MQDMWNEVTKEHRHLHPECDGDLYWPEDLEERRGFVWAEHAKCNVCTYTSKKYKLYEEVERTGPGRRAASVNVAVAAALTTTRAGPDDMRRIMLASNTPVPCTSTMQEHTEHLAEPVIEAAEQDMSEKRDIVKTVMIKRGQGTTEGQFEIAGEGDGVFNNRQGARDTPGQSGTQVSYINVENVTQNKFAIAHTHKNQLCHIGSRDNLDCPNHPGCTANLSREHTIGDEESWAKECLEDLLKDNIAITHMTTDGDSGAHRAANKLHEKGEYKSKPSAYLDTRHLASTHRTKIRNAKFSKDFFPGRLKADKDYAQKHFSNDLAKRCEIEYSLCFHKHSGNMRLIKSDLSHTKYAILKCYQGDHSDCKLHSMACKGRRNANWIKTSAYIDADFRLNVGDLQVNATDHDSTLLMQLIDFRISGKMLDKQALKSNTQAVEAYNHTQRSCNPQGKTFSRHSHLRSKVAIIKANNGAPATIHKLCKQLGSPIVPGSSVAKSLLSMEKYEKRQKDYKKTGKAKASRIRAIARAYRVHARVKQSKVAKSTLYKKGLLLPKIKCLTDHTYFKCM